MARSPRRAPSILFPTFLSLATLILIFFVALGGVGGKLTGIHYLKTDLSNLAIPARLEGSTFLQDISQVSGTDYVGQPSTASSLGLADSYTISLLTSCGHFSDGTIACSRPTLGYSYRPIADLRLDATSLEGTYSAEFQAVMWTYAKTNRFLAYAYIFAVAIAILAPITALCSIGLGAVLSTIGTVLLLAASVASTVVFRTVNNALNENFGKNDGLRSYIGPVPIILSFLAFGLSLSASIEFMRRACVPTGSRRSKKPVIARGVEGKDSEGLLGNQVTVTATGAANNVSEKKSGLWGRIPAFSRHKYVQVGEQPALVRTDAQGSPGAVRFASPDLRPRKPDDDWNIDDEYAQARTGGPGFSLSGNKATKDMSTAYEPYSNPK